MGRPSVGAHHQSQKVCVHMYIASKNTHTCNCVYFMLDVCVFVLRAVRYTCMTIGMHTYTSIHHTHNIVKIIWRSPRQVVTDPRVGEHLRCCGSLQRVLGQALCVYVYVCVVFVYLTCVYVRGVRVCRYEVCMCVHV
jgi:hypothetical protein